MAARNTGADPRGCRARSASVCGSGSGKRGAASVLGERGASAGAASSAGGDGTATAPPSPLAACRTRTRFPYTLDGVALASPTERYSRLSRFRIARAEAGEAAGIVEALGRLGLAHAGDVDRVLELLWRLCAMAPAQASSGRTSAAASTSRSCSPTARPGAKQPGGDAASPSTFFAGEASIAVLSLESRRKDAVFAWKPRQLRLAREESGRGCCIPSHFFRQAARPTIFGAGRARGCAALGVLIETRPRSGSAEAPAPPARRSRGGELGIWRARRP